MTRLGGGVAGGGLAPITRLSPVSDGSQSPGPGPPQPGPGVQRRSCPWPRLLDTPFTFTTLQLQTKFSQMGHSRQVLVQPSPGVQRNRGAPSPSFIKEKNHKGRVQKKYIWKFPYFR